MLFMYFLCLIAENIYFQLSLFFGFLNQRQKVNIIVDYIKLDLGYCQPDIGAVLVLTFLDRGYTKDLALDKGKKKYRGMF